MSTRKYTPDFSKYQIDASSFERKVFSSKAIEIHAYGIDCVKSFFELFETVKNTRRPGGGLTSHSEQDLLRSMIVFSAANLDIVVKQIIKDMINIKEQNDSEVRKKFKEYSQKLLSKDEKRELIVDLLTTNNAKDVLITMYTNELTGNSLQSLEELLKIASVLNIEINLNKTEKEYIKECFEIRNKIIHELDYDFSNTHSRQRKRIQRKRDDMIKRSEKILEVSKLFIKYSAM